MWLALHGRRILRTRSDKVNISLINLHLLDPMVAWAAAFVVATFWSVEDVKIIEGYPSEETQ